MKVKTGLSTRKFYNIENLRLNNSKVTNHRTSPVVLNPESLSSRHCVPVYAGNPSGCRHTLTLSERYTLRPDWASCNLVRSRCHCLLPRRQYSAYLLHSLLLFRAVFLHRSPGEGKAFRPYPHKPVQKHR